MKEVAVILLIVIGIPVLMFIIGFTRAMLRWARVLYRHKGDSLDSIGLCNDVPSASDPSLRGWLDYRTKEVVQRQELNRADAEKCAPILKRIITEDIRRGLFNSETGCAELADIAASMANDDSATRLLAQHLGNVYAEASSIIFGMPDESETIMNFYVSFIPLTRQDRKIADLMFAMTMAFFVLANYRASKRVSPGEPEVRLFQEAFDNTYSRVSK